MITIFNRKELITTFDMKKQADVRNILKDNDIDYDTACYLIKDVQ